MKAGRRSGSEGGFSLVEILVVTAMMGLVAMAVFSLYQTTQRTATTQDNVVELQQNLRIALDRMERDIRMAGFMVPSTTTPLSAATANSLTIQTASAVGRIARMNLSSDVSSPASITALVDFTIASAEMVDLFSIGDVVRILRPPDQSQPISGPFTVSGKDRDVPKLTLTGFTDAGVTYKSGDVIVRTTNTAPDPNTITYALVGNELHRIANGTSATVADRLTSLELWYLLNDGTRTNAPGDLSAITAVEIRLNGQAASQEGTKTREIQGVVNIRN